MLLHRYQNPRFLTLRWLSNSDTGPAGWKSQLKTLEKRLIKTHVNTRPVAKETIIDRN